jgi:hypothetical protein
MKRQLNGTVGCRLTREGSLALGEASTKLTGWGSNVTREAVTRAANRVQNRRLELA